jgi:ATP phosphoribosyltransferase regulatory subunit
MVRWLLILFLKENDMKQLVHTPDGVRDIYGEEFLRKVMIENKIKDVIKLYGYEDIATPTFEYFDVFSKEIGTTPSKDLYKFFDKDGNTLVLRPDFTPSVARCVAKYFDEEKDPIRLTYCGNTFVNNSSLQGKLKEVTEIGCELMNDSSVEADAEILNLVIESLLSSGLKDFQISVGEMNFFKGLCEYAGMDTESELLLREAISTKNSFTAHEMINSLSCDEDAKEQLNMCVNCIGGIEKISSLKDKITNERSLNAIKRLEELVEILKIYNTDSYVSFDLGMLSKYNYYTGIIFKAYTYGLGDALVKGGRYDNLLESFGSSKPAVGFVVVIDDLLMALRGQHILPDVSKQKTILEYGPADYEETVKKAQKLRKEGKAVTLIKRS